MSYNGPVRVEPPVLKICMRHVAEEGRCGNTAEYSGTIVQGKGYALIDLWLCEDCVYQIAKTWVRSYRVRKGLSV